MRSRNLFGALLDLLCGGLGRRGERAAEKHLTRMGFRTLVRNFRVPGGEVDLLMQKGGLVVAVEVKCRTRGGAGEAFAAVSPAQARRVLRAAVAFCRKAGLSVQNLRLDAVAVVPRGIGFSVTHLPGALSGGRPAGSLDPGTRN